MKVYEELVPLWIPIFGDYPTEDIIPDELADALKSTWEAHLEVQDKITALFRAKSEANAI